MRKILILGGALILVLVPMLTVVSTTPVSSQTNIIFNVNASGNINGAPLAGMGTITIVPTVNFMAVANFTEIAADFNPLAASGGSNFCIMCCCGGCTATYGGSESLLDIFAGEWSATVNFTILYNETIVGKINQTLEVTKITDYQWNASMVLNGWYSGPLDLVSSEGYIVHLNQVGTGEIEGNYVHKIFCENNTYIENIVTRRYTYNSTNELPFPETLHTITTNMSYVNGILNIEGQGYYEPEGIVGGIAEFPQLEEPGAVPPDLSEHNYGALAGIIVGAVVGTIALIGAVWYVRRRRTKAT